MSFTGRNVYVEEKLAAWDRDFLLTRAFAPAALRRPLSALHALRAELRSIPLEVADPGVALTKIGWWHDEWGRLGSGQPRHPVTQELRAAGLAPPPLDPALAATAKLIESASVESRSEVSNLVRALARPLAELEGRLGATEAPFEDWERVQWVGLLEDLARLAGLGRAPVPLELLAAERITRDGLAVDEQALARVGAALVAELDPPSAPPRAHAGVYRAVQELKLARYRAGSRIPPGAWSRLWAAWRAGRALKRGT